MITIKSIKEPVLNKCKMLCDISLDDKLNNYELTQYLNKHQFTVIVGKPGTGKSSLLYSLFKTKSMLKNVYDKIFVFQPPSSRNSMSDDIFGSLPEDQLFDDLNIDNLNVDLDEGNNCLIIDDCTASLKDNEIQKQFKQLIYNRRHCHLSIFLLVQSYNSIPLNIRKTINNIFIFKTSKQELNAIFNELIEGKSIFINDILKIVYSEPHNYLFINIESQEMFKNFNKLIFSS